MKYDKEIDEFVEQIGRQVGGWCNADKMEFLMRAIVSKKMTTIYEVGVWEGKSALPMARALQLQGTGMLYPIDSYCIEDATAHGEDYEEQFCSLQKYKDFKDHITRLGLGKHVYQMPPTSSLKASFVLQHPADLLHIDGNHSQWSSIEDLIYWIPKLKIGGILILDDTGRETTQIQQRVAETRCEILKDAGQWKAYTKIK
jgi:hypothetical protein